MKYSAYIMFLNSQLAEHEFHLTLLNSKNYFMDQTKGQKQA